VKVDETSGTPETRFVLAPDPASEAREVVREVLAALEDDLPLHEIAVFHGADPSYRHLLHDAFTRAGSQRSRCRECRWARRSRARRPDDAVLPEEDYRRTAVLDFLSIAPLEDWLPAGDSNVRSQTTVWDKVSRDAGVTRGREVWRKRLAARLADIEAEIRGAELQEREDRVRAWEFEREAAANLLKVVETWLMAGGASATASAADFIAAVKAIVADYFALG
jgi:hypothetical protein